MKRSVMAEKIIEALKSFPALRPRGGALSPLEKDIMYNKAASVILDVVEKYGMSPPTNYYNTLLTPPTQTPTGNLEYRFHIGWDEEDV